MTAGLQRAHMAIRQLGQEVEEAWLDNQLPEQKYISYVKTVNKEHKHLMETVYKLKKTDYYQ